MLPPCRPRRLHQHHHRAPALSSDKHTYVASQFRTRFDCPRDHWPAVLPSVISNPRRHQEEEAQQQQDYQFGSSTALHMARQYRDTDTVRLIIILLDGSSSSTSTEAPTAACCGGQVLSALWLAIDAPARLACLCPRRGTPLHTGAMTLRRRLGCLSARNWQSHCGMRQGKQGRHARTDRDHIQAVTFHTGPPGLRAHARVELVGLSNVIDASLFRAGAAHRKSAWDSTQTGRLAS